METVGHRSNHPRRNHGEADGHGQKLWPQNLSKSNYFQELLSAIA